MRGTTAILLIWAAWLGAGGMAQTPADKAGKPPKPPVRDEKEVSSVAASVSVKGVARDEEIQQRIQSVLNATEWFTAPQVSVKEGVVFLNGRAESANLRKWAGDLARNTQDVVAVANSIEVTEPSVWDFSPAWAGLTGIWREFIRSLPFLGFALLILALSLGAALLATRGARVFLRHRISATLLRKVIANGFGILVFLFGTYIVLRISGLTQLALTVVGGTGLLGLAVGIAFREITENFLASVFLSMQRPFEPGDLLEVTGVTGYVQQLNMRTTVLMTLDGTLVQIPNSSVYKTNLRNFTTNPNRREDFLVGIGYDDSINDAQEIARRVLADHPAVLNDSEPAVLADSLGGTTINLRVYFWLDGREHSWLKVRSSVIRLVKLAFQKEGISMPDEAREVVFPQGVPVTMMDNQRADTSAARPAPRIKVQSRHEEPDAVSTKAEAGLYSEAAVIEQQARQARPLENGQNLLQAGPRTPLSKSASEKPSSQ